MTIKEFIQKSVLTPRLGKAGLLVVYDPDRRYRELCLEMETPERQVIDAGESSIESRERTIAALQALGESDPQLKELLVYVPARVPRTDEEKQRDPFAVVATCGAVFPAGDGDEYRSLCLKAKADHATEIRRIFAENPDPSFAVIDALGGGAGWPTLQALLGVESARDILFALLAPTESQEKALKSDQPWVPEAKALLQASLGMKLLTKSKSRDPIADELWRFLLFSEFVFDLPAELPGALQNVPRAQPEAKPLVEDLCERLRNDQRTQALYIERAETVEGELNLPELCAGIADLGVRETFPFEERSFFSQAIAALKSDDVDTLRRVLDRHAHSVWVGKGENQTEWQLLQAATRLIESCDDVGRQLPDHIGDRDKLIDYYIGSIREADRYQRELEHAAGDYFGIGEQLAEVIGRARKAHRQLTDKVQGVFVNHLEKAGWPPLGRLANADVFDRVVAPGLQQSGHRVALFLIDALRYELGVELQKQIVDEGQVELQAAFAQLPTVTPVGMASLLPGAGQHLRLVRKQEKMVPVLGEQPLTNVSQRMDVLRDRFGERFAEMPLASFVKGKEKVAGAVDLLVLRSNEMDEDFEKNSESAPGLISRTFQQVKAAIRRLRELGFREVVIATDHGFHLNTALEAGDTCAKPAGTWVTVHDRFVLGDGVEDGANFVLPAEHLGIRGEFKQVGGPRALVAYSSGQTYLHGGASLQEAVVPVISVRLQTAGAATAKKPTVTLSYKRGSKKITTRLPVFEIMVGQGDLFSAEAEIEVLLEAYDKSGNVVGEAKPGGPVNPATRTITLNPNDAVQVTMKMEMEFEGKFTVKVIDPTTLSIHSKLDLETDYTV
jgi:hypothetical protein